MKIIIFRLSLLLIVFSCSKNSSNMNPVPIDGTWDWIVTYPGGNPSSYPYYPFTPLNTGERISYKFSKNSQFIQSINDTIKLSGFYTIGHGIYQANGTPASYTYIYDSIAYYVNGVKIGFDYYKIYNNDTLHFNPFYAGIIGGGYKLYIRRK